MVKIQFCQPAPEQREPILGETHFMLPQNGPDQEFEAQFMAGVRIYRESSTEEALEHFSQMLSKYPRSVGVLMFLGQIHQQLGDLDLSIEYASNATKLSPISEKSSLILHHSLIEAGFRCAAYSEMERFLNTAGTTSKLYSEYLNDLVKALDMPKKHDMNNQELVKVVIERMEQLGEL